MKNRYCIKDLNTGFYYCDRQWGEEPEWFELSEASRVQRIELKGHASPTRIECHQFDYLCEVQS